MTAADEFEPTEPDELAAVNHGAPDWVVQVRLLPPLFVSVSDLEVDVEPKSTVDGETLRLAGEVTSTESVAVAGPPLDERESVAWCAPGVSAERFGVARIVIAAPPASVPDDGVTVSQLGLDIDHENEPVPEFETWNNPELSLGPSETVDGEIPATP